MFPQELRYPVLYLVTYHLTSLSNVCAGEHRVTEGPTSALEEEEASYFQLLCHSARSYLDTSQGDIADYSIQTQLGDWKRCPISQSLG